jgi:DNA-directed RNA polymerase specialized sigma24 family protein
VLEQRTQALRRCLRELEADDAEAAAVVRGRMAGRGYDVICQELGLKPERAHKLFHEAKQRLRQCTERAVP